MEHWQSFLALVNMIMFCTGIPGHYPVNETTSSLTLTFWYTLQVSDYSGQPAWALSSRQSQRHQCMGTAVRPELNWSQGFLMSPLLALHLQLGQGTYLGNADPVAGSFLPPVLLGSVSHPLRASFTKLIKISC